MRSLRARLSLGVGLVIAVVLGVVRRAHLELRGADRARGPRRPAAAHRRAVARHGGRRGPERACPEPTGGSTRCSRATGSSLRLFIDDAVVLEAGRPAPAGGIPPTGLRTVTRRGRALPRAGDAADRRRPGRPGQARGRVVAGRARTPAGRARLAADAGSGSSPCSSPRSGAFLAAGAHARTAAAAAAGRRADRRARTTSTSASPRPTGRPRCAAWPPRSTRCSSRLSASAAQRERALEATRRFAFDAGHELRTPLTTVQATLSALHRHPDVAPEQRAAMLEDALDEQRRLVELLDGLQALARGEATSHEHEDVDLADLVTRAVADTRAATRRRRSRSTRPTRRSSCAAGSRACACSSPTS